MAYDAIRDTHSSRSPSATPVVDARPSSLNPSNTGHHHNASQGYYTGRQSVEYAPPSSSRPSSSGGLRSLLNDGDEEPRISDRRSSGGMQGQAGLPAHRRDYQQPSIDSVLESPGNMPEGRGLSMLLNGPLATPSASSSHMPPGRTPTPTHTYQSPSILGSSTSPRFNLPPSSGGTPREYPFPPTSAGSSHFTPQRSSSMVGLYNPQKSPTYRSRPMPPSVMNPTTGFPSMGYRPPSRNQAPSPSPSVTSIHNLISPSDGATDTVGRIYSSPSMDAKPLPGYLSHPPSRTRTPSDSMSLPMSREPSGGQNGPLPNGGSGKDHSRRISGRMEMGTTGSPDESERRSSIMGWTGEHSATPSRSNLIGLVSPTDEEDEPRRPSRRLSVFDLASPGQSHTSLQATGLKSAERPANVTTKTTKTTTPDEADGIMDMDIPDGASALDVLASLSERAGSGRAKRRRESDAEDTRTEPPALRIEVTKEQERLENNEAEDKPEQGLSPETKEEPQRSPGSPESHERLREISTASEHKTGKDDDSYGALSLEEAGMLSPSARAASPFEDYGKTPSPAAGNSPMDLAAQIFPADEQPEAPVEPVVAPPPPPDKTEYKPHRRLTAPLSILKPLTPEDKAWYLDVRNCLNPLRKGCPVRTMSEAKNRISGPPGGEGSGSSLSARKRARDSPYTDGNDRAEDTADVEPWGAKRARKGPVEALNDQNDVAAHYNARGNQGREARTLSPTYGLKVCNNWIKSILMKRFVRRRPGVTDYDPEARASRANGRVLDMGCGKGGDIEKWNRLKVEEYVGIGKSYAGQTNTYLSNFHPDASDVASGSIQDFDERIKTYKKRLWYRPHLYVLDCFSYPIDVAIPRHLLDPKFDTLSMQFCMHYAFETEQKVRQMLSNISTALRPGGVFLGTTLSAHKIKALLDIIPETAAELRIGNPYYQIVFEKRNHEGIYGQAYSFTLADAVEDCTEWIVHWEPFVELARSYGLKQLYRKDFDEVYEDEQANRDSVALAERMGVTTGGHLNMDPEQWSACSIYMAFAFIKVDN